MRADMLRAVAAALLLMPSRHIAFRRHLRMMPFTLRYAAPLPRHARRYAMLLRFIDLTPPAMLMMSRRWPPL